MTYCDDDRRLNFDLVSFKDYVLSFCLTTNDVKSYMWMDTNDLSLLSSREKCRPYVTLEDIIGLLVDVFTCIISYRTKITCQVTIHYMATWRWSSHVPKILCELNPWRRVYFRSSHSFSWSHNSVSYRTLQRSPSLDPLPSQYIPSHTQHSLFVRWIVLLSVCKHRTNSWSFGGMGWGKNLSTFFGFLTTLYQLRRWWVEKDKKGGGSDIGIFVLSWHSNVVTGWHW
jgi:hypothetical protein